MNIRATVCQMHDDRERFAEDWRYLQEHIRKEHSDLVLLPEMVFASWFSRSKSFDQAVWDAAVKSHDRGIEQLADLAPAVVLGSRPVTRNGLRFNEGFIWEKDMGYQAAHLKSYLPDEDGFWEASWYHRGNENFTLSESRGAQIGFLICTDLWFLEHARAYGKAGADIIACPRATPRSTLDKWLTGGRTASIVSGAFGLSSNRFERGDGGRMGGKGWIISPDGEVRVSTSPSNPFATLSLDLSLSQKAKSTYPRYVPD